VGISTKKIISLTIISFGISLAIFLLNILGIFEFKAYDLFSRYLNPSRPPEQIVIIQVDQQSIDALSRQSIHWTWPRQVYAPVVEYLSEAEAVFLDILFTEPSSYGQEDDSIFSEAIRGASNVYLPVFLSRKEKLLTPEDESFIKGIALKEKIHVVETFSSVVTPTDLLKPSVRGGGNVTISPDDDGVYRRVPLVFQLGQYTVPHFVLSYLLQKDVVKVIDGDLYARYEKIPLDSGKLLPRYSKEENPFAVFSFIDILNSSLSSAKSQSPRIKKDFFRGKFVFVGLTAAGLYDLKPTPISSISTGVLIHATILDTILTKNFIRQVNHVFVIAFMFLICLFITTFVLRHHSMYINLSMFLLSLLIVLIVMASLFKNGLYMNIISPLLSLMMSFIISAAYSYAIEGKERIFIKRTFSQYMDSKIVDYILKNPSLIKPGGQRKRVTVFFSDITNFTGIAEKTSAEKTAMILHRILNALTEVIIRNGGVVDKYIGDSIMAFWGAPFETHKDEINACTAALQCIQAIKEINDSSKEKGIPDINIRIGMHTGDAIAGNIGSDRLFNYTVIGDAVNLASRLESVNKIFGTKILISEDTIKQTGNLFFVRELGLVEVKGKTIPIRIFELMDVERDVSSERIGMIKLFHKGLALYREKHWRDALEFFESILSRFPDDGPSEFYRSRCTYLMTNPRLTEGWDVVKMTEK